MNVGRGTWRREQASAGLGDDNKSSRENDDTNVWEKLRVGVWVGFFNNGSLLLRRDKGLRVIDLNWILWETYFIVNYFNSRYAWATTNLAKSLEESFCNIRTQFILVEFVQDLIVFRAICYVNEDVSTNK